MNRRPISPFSFPGGSVGGEGNRLGGALCNHMILTAVKRKYRL